MNKEAFVKDSQELIRKHKLNETGMILIFYAGDDGTTGYTGFGCPACTVNVILEALELGKFPHTGALEEHNKEIKH